MIQGLGFPLLSPEKKSRIRADETLIIGLDWKKVYICSGFNERKCSVYAMYNVEYQSKIKVLY